jgi:hypothetical protein
MILNRRWPLCKEAEEGEEGGGGVVTDDNKPKDAETGEPEVSADVIAKAEKMGWTPKDQFKGDPAKWRPADEFVERGENMLPLVRAQVKRQEREIAELKTSIRQFAEYHDKTEARAMEKALATLRQERADAIAKGDGVAFDKVDAEIEDLKKKAQAKSPPQAEEDPEFAEWLSRNPWANDKKLQVIGAGIRDAMIEDGEKHSTALLDKVTAEMKRRYPEHFENPRRQAAAAVEGGGAPRKAGGKSYADLPADARAACDRMAKNGYADKPKEMAEFKAQYVKNYFEA